MSADDGDPRIAGREDLDVVVSLLVSAFYDDPTWSWVFPDPAARATQQAWLWRLYVEGAMRYPWVWLAAGGTATAVWTPPGGTELAPEQEVELERWAAGLPGTEASRLRHAVQQFEGARPTHAPHFYLGLLGTGAEHRGRGLGLGLLAANLARVDQAGLPAYLEASNPANVALYERYGFVPVGGFRLPDGGPDVVTMWREPRTAG